MIGNPITGSLGLWKRKPWATCNCQQDSKVKDNGRFYMPMAIFMESDPQLFFRWSGIRPPYMMATGNEQPLTASPCLFGYLLTNRGAMFSECKEPFWSPASIERVTGHKLQGKAAPWNNPFDQFGFFNPGWYWTTGNKLGNQPWTLSGKFRNRKLQNAWRKPQTGHQLCMHMFGGGRVAPPILSTKVEML